MGSRLELQDLLEDALDELLGERNVYYNPPPNDEMKYPAIKYQPYKIGTLHANNGIYKATTCYSITIISYVPNDAMVAKLLSMPMCSFDRHYTYDGLNHDVLRLYY